MFPSSVATAECEEGMQIAAGARALASLSDEAPEWDQNIYIAEILYSSKYWF